MEKFINKLIHKPILVYIAFGICFIAGIISFQKLPIDAFPDLTNNQVQILIDSPGMAPVEVEELITIPIESLMSGLPKVQELRSISKFGLSVITVVFKDNTNIYFARQIVNEKLQEAKNKLPVESTAELGPITTGMGEIYQYIVTGNGYSPMELKSIQDIDIKNKLRSIQGVNEVNTWGGFTQEYQIILSPEKLLLYNISLQEVFDAISNNNENFSGGIIEHNSEQYTVRGLGKIQSLEDIENILIHNDSGNPVRVRNIAELRIGEALRQGAVTKDGKGEVVAGIVMMLKGENSREVIKRVKEKIKEINKSLPESVRVTAFYDQTNLVEQTIKTVKTNLLEGGLLVLVVLLLMLGNLRAALIAAVSIPISLMFSFIGMKALGITANIMSLGAIDFGMIVDGSIVMVENILRKFSHNSPDTKETIIKDSIHEMAKPIAFGIVIISIVYLPILSLEGIEYKMFSPMVFTLSFALLGSLLCALILVPVLAKFFLQKDLAEKENWLIHKVKQPYLKTLKRFLEKPSALIKITLLAFIIALFSLPFLGTEFVPRLDEGDLMIEMRNLPSISLSQAVNNTTVVEQAIKRVPEVLAVVSKTGRPDLGTDPMGVFASDIYVHLKPKSKWRYGFNKEKLIESISQQLNKSIIGVSYNFTQPIAMRVDELVSGVRSDVAVKIFGKDTNILLDKATEIEKQIKTVKGQSDLQVEKIVGSKQLVIRPNRKAMALYNVDVSDLRDAINTAIIGTQVTEILDGKKRYALRVKLSNDLKIDPDAFGALLIETHSESKIPLSQLSQLEIVEGIETINREFGERRIVVQMNVHGRDMGSFVKEAKKKIEKSVNLAPGYFIEWGGQFENQERAMKKLMWVVPLAILLILGLLVLTFNSLKDALIVFINIPFALIGGVLALWLRGMYLSVPAVIGFIALFGVAVLNGLVLISTIKKLHNENHNLEEAILLGAETRLRPVLMTAMVAVLGFLPMAISHGAGAEIQKPLASVVIGGLISSTLLTLVVLPVIYFLANKKNN